MVTLAEVSVWHAGHTYSTSLTSLPFLPGGSLGAQRTAAWGQGRAGGPKVSPGVPGPHRDPWSPPPTMGGYSPATSHPTYITARLPPS